MSGLMDWKAQFSPKLHLVLSLGDAELVLQRCLSQGVVDDKIEF
jgi:hypothetical protein